MKTNLNLAMVITSALFACAGVFADAGHDHDGMKVTFGSPGKESEVTKTINVEANDQMKFVFDRIDIKQGDVVKFVVRNTGKVRHEFSIGDTPYQRAHAAMMKKMPDMVHNDPNMVTLESGETKTVIWKFDKPVQGKLVFACHEPGHFEAGMKIDVVLVK